MTQTARMNLTIFKDIDDPLHAPLVFIYTCILCVAWFYSISRWRNLLAAARYLFFPNAEEKRNLSRAKGQLPSDHPHVTVQIVSYNEENVVVKTIEKAFELDWPKDKLTVQILDDSTTKSSRDIIHTLVSKLQMQGGSPCIQHLRRPHREGYKAGNLRYHFDVIQGDFVVQLDADHRLDRDFLKKAMPYFYDSNAHVVDSIGLVQAPWCYYNTHKNILTEVDALSLDMHHMIEQIGRSQLYGVFGFNGTGGIWRKQAIKSAGGWTSVSTYRSYSSFFLTGGLAVLQQDSVTEDLALSYHAAVAGYKFVFVPEIPQALELPPTLTSHIQQKKRWSKGFFQVFRQDFSIIVKSPNLSWMLKLEAFCHMTAPVLFPATLTAMFIYPYIVLHGLDGPLFCFSSFFPMFDSVLSALITCWAKEPGENGHYKSYSSRALRSLLILPYFALKCGTALFESSAILEGLFSNDAVFLTTPKQGLVSSNVMPSRSSQSPLSSSNKVTKFLSDDIAAALGIFIGVHRLVFVLSHRTAMYVADDIHNSVNAFVVAAMFLVNGVFLVDKYARNGEHKNTRRKLRSSSRMRTMLLFMCLFLTSYSYMLAFTLNLAQDDFFEVMQATFKSIPPPRKRGVYFMASDKVLDHAIAFLNSFRHFNPTVPLTLIPYDEFKNSELTRMSDQYNFDVFFDPEKCRQTDLVAEAFFGKHSRHAHFRKLVLWSGPYEEFIYIDIDTLVLDNIEFAWSALGKVDFAVATSNTKKVPEIDLRDYVWNPSIDSAGLLSQEQIEFSGQTGFFVSSKRFASTDELLDRTFKEVVTYKQHLAMEYVDQPLLNYLLVTSGKKYSSLIRMAVEDGDTNMKLEVGSESKDVYATDDFRLAWKLPGWQPVFLLHWAGDDKKRGENMSFYDLFKYWRNKPFFRADVVDSSDPSVGTDRRFRNGTMMLGDSRGEPSIGLSSSNAKNGAGS